MSQPRRGPGRPRKDSLRQSFLGGVGDPQLRELVQEIFVEMGGANKIAKMLVKDLKDKKTNSFVRARIMDLVLRSVKQSNDMHAKDDLGLMTNEDLDRALEQSLQVVVEQLAVKDRGAGGCLKAEQGGQSGEQGSSPVHRGPVGASPAPGGGEGSAQPGSAEAL